MISNEIKKKFEGKKIAIWGFGLEGKSTFNFIRSILQNQLVTIIDDKEIYLDDINCEIKLTQDTSFDEYDLIMKSPGIVITDDHFPFDKLSSQSQIFLKYYKKQTIGITGTKGKSTTSSLLYHVLSRGYSSVFLVGNIGVPCFNIIHDLKEDSIVVFEISCHQLEYAKDSPHIGVLLNLFEEHLDHYGTFEKYCAAKENVFLHQESDDIAIINTNCIDQINKAKHPLLASMDETGDIYAIENKLVNSIGTLIVDTTRVSLIGHHNYYNMAIVYAIASNYFDISNQDFLEAIATFQTLKHRLENIGVHNGIRYIDDSISTICQSTIQAITSLNDVDTVLVGGLDRGIDYDELIDFLIEKKVPHVIFMYASGERMFGLWTDRTEREAIWVKDLKDAVGLAKKITSPGKSCLLSPASASYGYFKNFEERGDVFKELVENNEI